MSSTPSQEPSPPSKPEIPQIAHDKTERGSVAFMKYYYALVAYGHGSGDWKKLKELSHPDCTECAAFWTPRLTRFMDDEVLWPSRATTDTFGIRSNGTTPVITVYAAPGLTGAPNKIHHYPEDLRSWNDAVTLTYTNDGWRVRKIDVNQIEG